MVNMSEDYNNTDCGSWCNVCGRTRLKPIETNVSLHGKRIIGFDRASLPLIAL